MIFSKIFTVVIAGINWVIAQLPSATTLPTIGGFDTDSALVNAIGLFNTLKASVWVFTDLWYAFLALVTYWGVKILLKVLLGQRTPIHYN